MSQKPRVLKPILLYDHLPGILAGYPAVLFALLAVLSLSIFSRNVLNDEQMQQFQTLATQMAEDAPADSLTEQQKSQLEDVNQLMNNNTVPIFDPHMLFWIGLSIMLVWYVAFRFNMPKRKFMLMFFMLGTLVGIPVVLELQGTIRPFSRFGTWLGHLEPSVNTGAWVVMSLVFFVIWAGNYIYSRTHMRVRIDESGLTLNRLGGKGERFELIGLKTENEPLDYLELFLAGVGSLSLKTRMNKPIFTMKRVVGLYRTPWFPFFRGKLARIEEMLSYQGKVVSVERGDQLDAAEMGDAMEGDSDGMDQDDILDEAHNEDMGSLREFDSPQSANDSPDDRGFD